jgi:hypothetical protein
MLLLAMYDAFAVCCSCGPLNILVNMMNSNPDGDIPGLLFEAKLSHNQESQDTNKPPNEVIEEASLAAPVEKVEVQETEPDRDRIRLGLGDFVFYSLLLSRAAMAGLVSFITSYIFLLCVSPRYIVSFTYYLTFYLAFPIIGSMADVVAASKLRASDSSFTTLDHPWSDRLLPDQHLCSLVHGSYGRSRHCTLTLNNALYPLPPIP